MISTMTGQRWGALQLPKVKRGEYNVSKTKGEDGLKMKTDWAAMGLNQQGCQRRGKNMSATFLLLLSIPCSLQVPPKQILTCTTELVSPTRSLSKFVMIFHLTPPKEGVKSTVWNSVCLSVCHHLNISNIGPSNHPRIMSDPTCYTSLERGWGQQWQWQWN